MSVFPSLQGALIFRSLTRNLCDQDLHRLAVNIPVRVLEARAPSTVSTYSRAFMAFKDWSLKYEFKSLPASFHVVALYLEHLIESNCAYSKLECAFYGINWVHTIYGLSSPCDSGLVKSVLEAGKRALATMVVKKEPVSVEMMMQLCAKYATVHSSLTDLRVAALCVTAFNGFLRFNELTGLRCCDVKFSSHGVARFVQLFIVKSKTDIYRTGNKVLLAETRNVACPYTILSRYVNVAHIDLSSSDPFFRSLQYCRKSQSYRLRSTGLSYTRTREVILEAFASLGYKRDKFGLQSLRSGGATAAANAGVPDRLFKQHGRWKSETAKDGYVKDDLETLLSVSKSLHESV